jgi:trehalose synthase
MAMPLTEVQLEARSLDEFRPILGDQRVMEVEAAAQRLRDVFNGGVVWNVNSTAAGGGVAEMLRGLLSYARGLGVDSRWLVIEGEPEFFRVTKRLHHALHGSAGDGSPVGEEERAIFETVSAANAERMYEQVRPGDVVILHDPQTAGLVQPMLDVGALVVWRSHIGSNIWNEHAEQGWAFLRPYVAGANALVFTRQQYVPEWADARRVAIIPPSIDPFSPKNRDMDDKLVCEILICAGIIGGGSTVQDPPVYLRQDGSPARLEHCADVVCLGPAPEIDAPIVLQVSRWDPLKDPVGVMHGFAEYLKLDQNSRANLILAGPSVRSINDDPEQPATMDRLISEWRALPQSVRRRIRLVNLPMKDLDENAVMVNALQRHAAVVVQKSLQEGFGLTVTEAMWKGRPVIASAVGGIQDQIEDGRSGILLRDPSDTREFAAALQRVLNDPGHAEELGRSARKVVVERFLPDDHLLKYDELLSELLTRANAGRETTA